MRVTLEVSAVLRDRAGIGRYAANLLRWLPRVASSGDTVRALGDARVLTVDKKTFLRRIQEDLSLAFRVFQTMASRLNSMNAEMAVLKSPVLAG